jgi:ABC-type taurine transport system substrate-binding protein
MTKLYDALLEGVLGADEVVRDAEQRTQRWVHKRNNLTRIAHLNGVPVEDIATAVNQPVSTIHEWIGPVEGD